MSAGSVGTLLCCCSFDMELGEKCSDFDTSETRSPTQRAAARALPSTSEHNSAANLPPATRYKRVEAIPY